MFEDPILTSWFRAGSFRIQVIHREISHFQHWNVQLVYPRHSPYCVFSCIYPLNCLKLPQIYVKWLYIECLGMYIEIPNLTSSGTSLEAPQEDQAWNSRVATLRIMRADFLLQGFSIHQFVSRFFDMYFEISSSYFFVKMFWIDELYWFVLHNYLCTFWKNIGRKHVFLAFPNITKNLASNAAGSIRSPLSLLTESSGCLWAQVSEKWASARPVNSHIWLQKSLYF